MQCKGHYTPWLRPLEATLNCSKHFLSTSRLHFLRAPAGWAVSHALAALETALGLAASARLPLIARKLGHALAFCVAAQQGAVALLRGLFDELPEIQSEFPFLKSSSYKGY